MNEFRHPPRTEAAEERHARILREAAVLTFGKYHVEAQDCCMSVDADCFVSRSELGRELHLELDGKDGTIRVTVSVDKVHELRRHGDDAPHERVGI
jgi:hypothetical protein